MTASSDVGFDAGWHADFRLDGAAGLTAQTPELQVGRGDYDAELRVESDAAFRGATFQLDVDGLTDGDYDTIVGRPCPHVVLSMGWRDSPGSLLAGPASLVAAAGLGGGGAELPEVLVGRITGVQRSAGDYLYRTTVTGVDAAFARLQRTRSTPVKIAPGRPLIDYLRAVCAQAQPAVEVVAEGPQPGLDGRLDVPVGLPLDMVVQHLAEATRGVSAQAAVPLMLRRGRLHCGAWQGPVSHGTTHRLDAGTGLVEVVPIPAEDADPTPADPFARVVVDQFRVTLAGRADVHVGDVVELAVPEVVPTTGAAASGLGGLGVLAAAVTSLVPGAAAPAPRPFRVVAVTHQLGREVGFTTTLRVQRRAPRTEGAGDSSRASEAHRLAEEIDARARRAATARRPMDVGLVNRQSTQRERDGAMSVPAQRLQVRSGLADTPAPNVAVRADLLETPTQLVDKPYLTPFAFGATGLVVPHYPGTRVLHLNQGSEPANAVVAGCLWPDGQEPASKPGDWWLTLPTDVSPSQSSDDPAAESGPTGKAASDLIDGRGVRSLGVRALHIGVGRQQMPDVGARPPDATVDELVITSEKGNATLRFDAQGNIEISTDAEIRFTARKVTFDVDESVEVR